MSDYEIDIDDDSGSSGNSDGGGTPDKKPFVMRGHLLQEELAKGEKRFGEIDWSVRITEPPPKETQSAEYSEEKGLAAANGNVVEQHEWLTCQQFDGRDPVRDQRIPSIADIEEYAKNNPEAQLTLDPTLKLALENAKRNQATATPTLKPAGM